MPFPDPMREVLTVCVTIVYSPDMEETDDVGNRNEAFARTPHRCNSPASQRQRAGDQLEQLRIRSSAEHDGPLEP
jgi:hypothetical protein